MQILQCQLTIVKLAIGKNFIDQILNETLYSSRCRVVQCPASGLNNVGQHNQAGFAGLGLWAGISEIFYFNGMFSALLLGLMKEIFDETGAMMLPDGIDDFPA